MGVSLGSLKIIEVFVHEVAGLNICQRGDQALLNVRVIFSQLTDKSLYLLALLLFPAANRAGAAHNREPVNRGKLDSVLLFYIHQWPDNCMLPIISTEPGAHRCKPAGIKLIQEQGLDEIIQMVAEGYLVAAQFCCHSVDNATAHAGAERAVGGPWSYFLFNNAVAVGVFYQIAKTAVLQVLLDDFGMEPWIARINGHREEFKRDRRTVQQAIQDMQQGVGILAT